MKWLISALVGAITAVSGTLLHGSFTPIGLLISILAIVVGARMIARRYESRSCDLLFALGWIVIVIRASTMGNGGEILIQSDLAGNAYVFGGMISLAFTFILIRRERNRR